MTTVDSWSQCEDICRRALTERSISETSGWTLSLDNSETSGLDYVFDAISVMELPPAFPSSKTCLFLNSKVVYFLSFLKNRIDFSLSL